MKRRRNDVRISFFSFQDIITSIAGIMIFVALLMVLDVTSAAFTPPTMSRDLPSKKLVARRQRELEELLVQHRSEMEQLAALSSEQASLDPTELRRLIEQLKTELKRSENEAEIKTSARLALERQLVEAVEEEQALKTKIRSLASAKAQAERKDRRVVFTLPGEDRDRKGVLLIEVSASQVLMRDLDAASVSHRIRERGEASRTQAIDDVLGEYPSSRFDVLVILKGSAFADSVDWLEFFKSRGYRVGSEPLEEDRSAVE